MENAAGGYLQSNDAGARRVTTRPPLLNSHVAAPRPKLPRLFSTRAERRINLTLEQWRNSQVNCCGRYQLLLSRIASRAAGASLYP
jgi:hypothetical protein